MKALLLITLLISTSAFATQNSVEEYVKSDAGKEAVSKSLKRSSNEKQLTIDFSQVKCVDSPYSSKACKEGVCTGSFKVPYGAGTFAVIVKQNDETCEKTLVRTQVLFTHD